MTKYSRFLLEKKLIVKRMAELIESGYAFDLVSDNQSLDQKTSFEYYQPSAEASRMTDVDYAEMRMIILQVGASCQGSGTFNANQPASEKQATRFDREISVRGQEIFPLGLYEASRDEVWNYITLFVAPDIANWRYPNDEANKKYDRHLGGYRNVFRQPWMRGYFCNWNEALISDLTEDIAVAIFERTNLASNPKVAIACLKATHRIRLKDKNNKIYRDALKRVVRLMSVRSLDQLPEEELQPLIDSLFDQSYFRLSNKGEVQD